MKTPNANLNCSWFIYKNDNILSFTSTKHIRHKLLCKIFCVWSSSCFVWIQGFIPIIIRVLILVRRTSCIRGRSCRLSLLCDNQVTKWWIWFTIICRKIYSNTLFNSCYPEFEMDLVLIDWFTYCESFVLCCKISLQNYQQDVFTTLRYGVFI